MEGATVYGELGGEIEVRETAVILPGVTIDTVSYTHLLLDTYTTSGGGKFTTKEYPCGTDYSIREISPSEGYLPVSYTHLRAVWAKDEQAPFYVPPKPPE